MSADNIISYIKIPYKYNTYIIDHFNIFKNLTPLGQPLDPLLRKLILYVLKDLCSANILRVPM